MLGLRSGFFGQLPIFWPWEDIESIRIIAVIIIVVGSEYRGCSLLLSVGWGFLHLSGHRRMFGCIANHFTPIILSQTLIMTLCLRLSLLPGSYHVLTLRIRRNSLLELLMRHIRLRPVMTKGLHQLDIPSRARILDGIVEFPQLVFGTSKAFHDLLLR